MPTGVIGQAKLIFKLYRAAFLDAFADTDDVSCLGQNAPIVFNGQVPCTILRRSVIVTKTFLHDAVVPIPTDVKIGHETGRDTASWAINDTFANHGTV